ncbi:MAG: hypothetical protein HY812_06775 [Planctomycetes bacterium]|nr:hypothetical protein [Planctomycetota bacterium]
MGFESTGLRRGDVVVACALALLAAPLHACAGRQVQAESVPAPGLTITNADASWLQGFVIYTGGVSGWDSDGEESVINLGTSRGAVTLRGSEAGPIRDMVKKQVDRGLIAGSTDVSLEQTSGVSIPEDETPD